MCFKSRKEILSWAENFDFVRYPTKVYEELVINNSKHPNKFCILGAWKTGSLRRSIVATEYTDSDGNQYMFTKRWEDHTPVGKSSWTYINENIVDIRSRTPKELPSAEPEILILLKGRPGFGFIWGLFTLHCIYPHTYPLYDQHVYRAFRNCMSDRKEHPGQAPDSWEEYRSYKQFFDQLITEFDVDLWELDRALWTSGKELKQNNILRRDKGKSTFDSPRESMPAQFGNVIDVESLLTLGKRKIFWFSVDQSNDLTIIRSFQNFSNPTKSIFSSENIDSIQDYIKGKNDWVPLANNVELMRKGEEVDGIGSSVYNNIKADPTLAQSASQLVTIFTLAGIWSWNAKRKGMMFKYIEGVDWRKTLLKFCINLPDNES